MIVFGIIFCWALWQVDVVMAYPQAHVETDIYMELPQGIKTATGNSKDHVLKLLKNLYGQKQAGRVWNSFLVDKLTSLGILNLEER
jgi:transcriptional regulator GlxA family with amidase domain